MYTLFDTLQKKLLKGLMMTLKFGKTVLILLFYTDIYPLQKDSSIKIAFFALISSGLAAAASNPVRTISFAKKIGKIGYRSFFVIRYGKSPEAFLEHCAAEQLLQAQKKAQADQELLLREQQQILLSQREYDTRIASEKAEITLKNVRLDEQLKNAYERIAYWEETAQSGYERIKQLEALNSQLLRRLWQAEGLLQQSRTFFLLQKGLIEKQQQVFIQDLITQIQTYCNELQGKSSFIEHKKDDWHKRQVPQTPFIVKQLPHYPSKQSL